MMLARDRVHFTLDGRRYMLRPTLRAAIRLEASIGLSAVLAGIYDGSASIMCHVIREAADVDEHLSTILDGFSRPTMAANMLVFREPLAALVLLMLGINPDAEHKSAEAPATPPKPVAEVLAHLYRQATGWLGWTPSVALDATPAEITEALAGRVELLSAIFGSGKPQAEPVDLDTKARAIFGGLKQRFLDRQKAA